MELSSELNAISWLLDIALDSEEEYLYHGEMSDYVRSYAADAMSELDSRFRPSGPQGAEIDVCVEALSDPERIRRGRSKELLLSLRERSRPILDALANSPDPQLRIFALETAETSLNPFFYSPLYGTIDLKQRLLNDPDEDVRVAALSAAQQTVVHNAAYLEYSIRSGADNPILDFLYQISACLGDPSLLVRAEAAKALLRWAAEVGMETVGEFLDRENNPAAREILAKTNAPGDPTIKDDHPSLNDGEQQR